MPGTSSGPNYPIVGAGGGADGNGGVAGARPSPERSTARRLRTAVVGGMFGLMSDVTQVLSAIGADDLLALDEALTQLSAADPRRAELVKLRYFAGLTLEQAAEQLGIARATAARHWAFARAWLYDAMTRGQETS